MLQHYSLSWLKDYANNTSDLCIHFFWGHTNEHQLPAGKFCLSQWYPSPFVVDEVLYATAEHWMMAQKAALFDDLQSFEKIIACETPSQAKKLGRTVEGFDETTWDERKFDLVKLGNIHKFNQHKAFAEYLLGTGDAIIAEASPTDAVWGIGMHETHESIADITCWGENLLGFALMEVRDFLQEFGHFETLSIDLLPPWKKYPGIDPLDMFWRMGEGEQYVITTAQYWDTLDEHSRVIYELMHPIPPGWEYFY